MYIHLKLIGVLLILLALIHIFFYKYFKWETNLKSLSLINKQMMTTHTFFIALTIFLMGLLCLTSSTALIETSLGRKICLGLGVFWSFRLFFQFFVYSKKLWKGKKFETLMHILFSIFWVYFSTTFIMIYLN
ncbi:hypothetical protein FPF71_04555 [Algibacter amylolyticus]|uniref:Uncharacterized protein n=1 Tax=Algibacter amylolyticus TaxID=1608400 RepID=A0A5M7BHB0_9FLAO|nr:hypothetical protein [Algibacter amylolyticus]KAA5828110.1 hypothetical protein F2B50_04555 [Algibacter amylolyticus]MBB5267358.1 putative ferric reductase [Algibacter amylolyticus]TSJ82355.1 hypothetical protein FPF71_04555 [Algibacter amylolyticus]